jgi:hypothetical protein
MKVQLETFNPVSSRAIIERLVALGGACLFSGGAFCSSDKIFTYCDLQCDMTKSLMGHVFVTSKHSTVGLHDYHISDSTGSILVIQRPIPLENEPYHPSTMLEL